MRPIRLTMTAFGPYKQTETIQFDELQGQQLFVISGKTGAGKTTIFDAICFALYGGASGTDRQDQRQLRSDFAEDGTYTEVELEFEVKGSIYRILRRMAHVKQGNKSATGEKYEFTIREEDGEKPCVERNIVSEVNKKMESILGLSENQFRQIVMLPQGEFRKLLTSETENKEDILRKIFKTDAYVHFTEKLRAKKVAAEEAWQSEQRQLNFLYSQLQSKLPLDETSELAETLAQEHVNIHHVLTQLNKEIDRFTTYMSEAEQTYQTANVAHEEAQKTFFQAEQIHQKFQDLGNKTRELEQLQQEQPFIKEEQTRLQAAEKASAIQSVEEQMNDWKMRVQSKKAQLEQAEMTLSKATEQLAQAKEQVEQAELQNQERAELVEKLTTYRQLRPHLLELEESRQQVTTLFQKVEDQRNVLKQTTANVDQATKKYDELMKQMEKLEQHVENQDELAQRRTDIATAHKWITQKRNIEQQLHVAKQQFLDSKQQWESVKVDFEKQQSNWFTEQAAQLAAKLVEGNECPVCGSTHHPNKATHAIDVISQEALELEKSKLDQLFQTMATNEVNVKSLEQQYENLLAEMNEFTISQDKDVETVVAELNEVDLQWREMESMKKQYAQCVKDEKVARESLALLKESETEAKSTLQRVLHELDTLKALITDREKRIDVPFESFDAFETHVTEVTARYETLQRQWETANEQLKVVDRAHHEAKVALQSAERSHEEDVESYKVICEKFEDALAESQFESVEAYESVKLSNEARKLLKEKLDVFYQQLHTVQVQVDELTKELSGREKPDIDSLREQVVLAKEKASESHSSWQSWKQVVEQAKEGKRAIEETYEQSKERQRTYEVALDLYDTIRGQNPKKLSFERYVLMDYLDQIVEAANERLKHLSNGQFLLVRSERQEARGKQSGLSLDVFDAYTGLTRDVKTLSGGEKFNASLALALGMADVIQRFQGGVEIQTMFIDEGFGSLDEESLTRAIDTLIDLQRTGRLIGVISHVAELKSAIPATLEVEKMKDGSSRTRFVVR